MVDRVGGSRRKTRYKLKKDVSEKGKISIRKYMQKFEEGDQVVLKAEPAVQNGMYHPRFHGKRGIVSKNVGTCYEVKIKDFTKEKIVVVHPVHLTKC
ncbi:MAG: 50S ribosomal protein L21e [Candidatus Nanoarchaeia archaeon]|nr:50S ribosomal protein L21e [Candidatus Nanoarchaeia archaeon]